MKNNPLMVIGLVLILLLCVTSPLSAASVPQRSIRVGGDNHLPPYEYVNDNGIYKGFNVDIMHAIAIQAGLDFELQPMPWYALSSAMDKGEIDVIQGMALSEATGFLYDFTEPYLTVSRGIFVRWDNNYVVDLEDLANIRVAVQKGNVPAPLLQHVDVDNLIYVDNQQQGILLLMMGNIDAFVGNKLVGLYTIQKWMQTNFIKVVGGPIEPAKYGIAVSKGNPELVKVFNNALKEIKANGTYDKIYMKWFGEIIQTPAEIWANIFNKLLWAVGGISFVFLVILRWNQLLKKEVRKRTVELAEANNLLRENNVRIEKADRFKEQILDTVFHGVITLEKNGIINFSNSEARELLAHFGEGEIVGCPASRSHLDKFIDYPILVQALQEGSSCIDKEKTVVIEGEEKIFSYSIYPLKYGGEELNGAIVTFRDITREKQLQEKLIYRDKMQSLGELVAVIAHEVVRNPIMAIKTFIELIPTKLDNRDFRMQLSHHVPQELERISKLVSDLLEYARPRRARKEDVHVAGLLDEILSLFKRKFAKNNISIFSEVSPNTVICADRQQLKQILINLIINSIQAIRDQGFIEINVAEQGDNCVLKVKDNGVGIPAQYLGKVMDPFFTLKKDGSGLGLSISYQLVKEHGGNIDIESKEGQGTTVTVVLPNRAC